MDVRDVMTSPVVTAATETGFKELCELLLANGISGVPIVDPDEHLVGIVTEADLMTKAAYDGERRPLALVAAYLRGRDPAWVRKAAALTAADLMTAGVLSVAPRTTLESAARLMLERHVNRLPVVEKGKVVGIVSRQDLLAFFMRGDEAVRTDVQAILDDPFNGPDRYDVAFDVHEGTVRLWGSARFESDVRALVSTVRHTPGVVAVQSEVRFRHRDEHVGPFV